MHREQLKNTSARQVSPPHVIPLALLLLYLQMAPVRRTNAEDRLDTKFMYYQEDDDRIRVLSPTVQYQTELSPTLTIRIDGIYNAISGASPTGAPPVPTTRTETRTITVQSSPSTTTSTSTSPAPVREEDDDRFEGGEDDDSGRRRLSKRTFRKQAYAGFSGATGTVTTPAAATPSATSSTSATRSTRTETVQVPTGDSTLPSESAEDTRVGGNIELIKRLGNHTLSGMFSYSEESDYESFAFALKHAIDFNRKNTTLQWGVAVTHDIVDNFYGDSQETKDSFDFLLGLTQVLDARTLLTLNLSLGYVTGYLDDPYKVVELNGVLVPEHRPDNKTKQIVFVSLLHYFDSLRASLEGSYRLYNDSFGIMGHTIGVAWNQKIRDKWVLSPSVRFYDQTAADFYGVRFSGTPTDYSADYRISALSAVTYGVKLTWFPRDNLSIDIAYDRYEQEGKDAETSADAYPSANMITAGATLWF